MGIADIVFFKVLVADRGWKLTRNDQLVSHYPSQSIAAKAAARQARAEADKGNEARAIVHKGDGTVATERSYSQITAPGLRPKVR